MIPLDESLFPNDIDIEKDIFLGETSVQIKSFDDLYPSVHLVKSYQSSKYEDHFYHIFEYKTGTSVMNYRPKQYEQVTKFIDLSNHWTIFLKTNEFFMPVSKRYRTNKKLSEYVD